MMKDFEGFEVNDKVKLTEIGIVDVCYSDEEKERYSQKTWYVKRINETRGQNFGNIVITDSEDDYEKRTWSVAIRVFANDIELLQSEAEKLE